MSHDPRTEQNAIIQDFELFPDWMDRYQYLIDLGKKLEPLAEGEKTDDNLLEGCQSQVWLLLEGDKDQVRIRANSDAAIVSGLIALLTRVYSGSSAEQILGVEPFFIERLGLSGHLSPTRSNGLNAMLTAIRAYAAAALAGED